MLDSSFIFLANAETTHVQLMTVATAIAAGSMLIVLARRLRVPTIVVLLAGGVLLGPEFLGIVNPESLGEGLLVIVSIAIGLILFEGGLTLDMTGYRSAPGMIKRLLTLGILITWIGVAISIWLIFELPVSYSVVAASLVIVTGPTVIAPLLKRIKVNERLHSILHWEGVLIDPIGVFIALLCFEWISGAGGQAALTNLLVRVAWGMLIGVSGGLALAAIVKRNWVSEEMINVFALGFAVLIFTVADAGRSEAGLLAVTAAGFVFGLTGRAKLKLIRQFKAEITDLLIGLLFILLAARLSIEQFLSFGWNGVLMVGIVILLIRPLSIFVCSFRTDLSLREKVFLSWVAPRGIVAASMASLIALRLETLDLFDDPRFIETFTYAVIISTILLQGSTAGLLAGWLRVKRPDPVGWLIVGAHAFARRIAGFIARTAELPVVLVDTNTRAVSEARDKGFVTISGDARDTTMADRTELRAIGNVLALTDNEDLNVRLCQNWAGVLGSNHVFRCDPTSSTNSAENGEETEAAGIIVWAKLPKPSLVTGELQRGEASVLEATGNQSAFTDAVIPLAALIDGKVVLDPKLDSDDEESQDTILYLQRKADYLERSLRPELITTIDAADLKSLLEQMVDLIVTVHPSLPRDTTVDELMEREKAFPTALGHGIGVPHAYCQGLDKRICAIAHVPGGVDFLAADGEPVRLAFLLLSPKGDPEGHLATLAEIARLVFDADVRERLLAATSALEVIRIVHQASASG